MLIATSSATYKVLHDSNQTGIMKDGSIGNYVVIQDTSTNNLVELHPNKMAALIATGVDATGQYRVVTEIQPVIVQSEQKTGPFRNKKEAAMVLFKESPTGKRSDIIAKFVSELDMTLAGASTYYYNIKKELGL
jgi:hypothetical protein